MLTGKQFKLSVRGDMVRESGSGRMKMFRMYLMAQYKRTVRLIPAALAATAVLMCCLGLLSAVLLQADADQERKQVVEIGLVGSTEGSYLGFGIQALQSLDSSRFAIAFSQVESEKAAREALERGELSAYVAIPDGFVEDLVRGNNVAATYVTSSGAAEIGSLVMSELIGTISCLITESQHAIYSTQKLLCEQGRQDIYRETTDRLYLRFLDLILGRELIYEMELTGVSDGLSITEYYTCGTTILFLLLWGIAATPFLAYRDAAMPKLLQAGGLSVGRQILAEYLSYTVFLSCCFLGTALLAFNTFDWLLGMLPVVMLFAAMHLCVCERISNPVSGMLIQFLGAVGLGYLSGCFYPLTFFPAEIQRLALFLPSGAAMKYGGKLITGQPFPGELAVMGAYGVGCFFLTVIFRKRRLAR